MRARTKRCLKNAPRRPRSILGHAKGAAMVEAAVVLMIFITLVLGMLDFGLAITRSNIVSRAAREGVRKAIVHGEFADLLGKWGPTTYEEAASADHPIADAIRPSVSLGGIDPADVTLRVEWPDGGNAVNDRVAVTVTTTYTPMVTFLFGSPTFTLQGSSTMTIAH